MLFSCKDKKNIENLIEKQVSRIETLAEFSFRRSYVDHHLLSKKEFDELRKSNPYLENYDHVKRNPKIFNELKKAKILLDDDFSLELNLKRFENIFSTEEKYLDSEKRILFIYNSDFSQSNSINIKLKNDNVLIEKEIDFGSNHFIGMILEDVDNDGIKEILIVLNYYVMNGDNYILIVNKLVE